MKHFINQAKASNESISVLCHLGTKECLIILTVLLTDEW